MFIKRITQAFLKLRFVFLTRSIKADLLVAFLIVALLPAAVINFYYYSMMHREMNNKIQSYTSEIIRQVGQTIDTMLAQTELIQKQIISVMITSVAPELEGNMSPEEKLNLPYKTDRLITNIIRDFPPISDAYFIESGGDHYSSSMNVNYELLDRKEWIHNAADLPAAGTVIPTHYNDYYDINRAGNMFPVVSFIKRVNYGKGPGSERIGVAQVDLKYDAIAEIIENARIDGESLTYLTDGNGRVIYSNDSKDFGKTTEFLKYNGIRISELMENPQLMKKNNAVVLKYEFADYKWNLITVLSTDVMYKQLNELKNLSVLVMGISLIITLIMSFTLSGSIIRPINRMVGAMKKVEGGDFNVTVPDIGYRDLHVLSASFNKMISEIDVLMKNMIEKETEKTNAQLKALQAQINPHFLYNTLEVVRSIALENKVKSIAEISKSLSGIFRYSISKEKDIVTVGEEIEHIRNYLKIQHYRFGDKLEALIDIGEDAMKCKIPRFIIQPLVENSIFHGIETKLGKGTIRISASRSEGVLDIWVSDNGTGIPADKLESIKHALNEYGLEALKDNNSSLGIGVLNVNMRLKLLYGDKCHFEIKSIPYVETTVHIQIPEILGVNP